VPRSTFDGAELRRRRLDARITPTVLGALVGRSADTIHGYESGRTDPPTSILLAICDELKCTPSDLCSVGDLYIEAVVL
jgi:DNA-binding Xre family transcriptional regulator